MAQAAQAFFPETETKPAGPFLKWAGGKGKLLDKLSRFFPDRFKSYYEPFAGSAAVFFFLRAKYGDFRATLSDSNEELINCFEVVRDKLEVLIPLLQRCERGHSKKHYYCVRQQNPAHLTPVQRAARFIYLNKTCYNGLYRVNTKGEFNVPVGSYKRPKIFNEKRLRAASLALKNTRLLRRDFSDALYDAKPGDFIYFDPPYHTESSGFTGYAIAKSGKPEFTLTDHLMLRNVAEEVRQRGCHVVLSNSDSRYVRELYKSFDIHEVEARRFINCNGAGRSLISEFVIVG